MRELGAQALQVCGNGRCPGTFMKHKTSSPRSQEPQPQTKSGIVLDISTILRHTAVCKHHFPGKIPTSEVARTVLPLQRDSPEVGVLLWAWPLGIPHLWEGPRVSIFEWLPQLEQGMSDVQVVPLSLSFPRAQTTHSLTVARCTLPRSCRERVSDKVG